MKKSNQQSQTLKTNFFRIRLREYSTSVFILFLLFQTACNWGSDPDQSEVAAVVERVGKELVPDSRVDIFKVSVEKTEVFVLTGEVLNPTYPLILLDSLTTVFPNAEFSNRIVVLPSDSVGAKNYGVVNISVANMRRSPRFQAELVNQAVLGTVVRILKEERGFYYIQNLDRYLGWMTKGSLVEMDSLEVSEWQNGPQVICTSNYGIVADVAGSSEQEFLVDLVPGAALLKVGERSGFIRVQTPDDRIGFVDRETVRDKKELAEITASPERVLNIAKQFLGVPYLWGGTSAKGFDCSGFVQTVFRLNNIELPRDASQIEREGEKVEPGENFENLVPGDLIFFGSSPERISHVAIYMGDLLYIHSSTSVHINSLDKEHPLYNDYRFNTFRTVKRIL